MRHAGLDAGFERRDRGALVVQFHVARALANYQPGSSERAAERAPPFVDPPGAFCPSCGARRMVETGALLVDEVLPREPLRQWVLSVPFALRFLLATHPQALSEVLGIAYHTIAAHLIEKAGLTRAQAQTGAVT
jgi:hypothetical protein